MIPVISGRQDVLQSAVLRDVVRQSVDHAPKTHNNKITLRKGERKRERERMSLAGTRHAAGHKRQRAFPRVCSSAEGLRVEARCLVLERLPVSVIPSGMTSWLQWIDAFFASKFEWMLR